MIIKHKIHSGVFIKDADERKEMREVGNERKEMQMREKKSWK